LAVQVRKPTTGRGVVGRQPPAEGREVRGPAGDADGVPEPVVDDEGRHVVASGRAGLGGPLAYSNRGRRRAGGAGAAGAGGVSAGGSASRAVGGGTNDAPVVAAASAGAAAGAGVGAAPVGAVGVG